MAEGRDRAGTGEMSDDKQWVKVQKQTFTNWVNDRLKETGLKVEDLRYNFDDGITLVKLLEVLAHNKKMPKYRKNPKLAIQKQENLTVVFKFMKEDEKIELVNIGPVDILEHNLKLVLGLVWTLIQRYQLGIGAAVEEPPQGTSTTGSTGSTQSKSKPKKKKASASAKKLLLGWVKATIPELEVGNLNSDWNDGIKLSALVDTLKPGLIPNYSSLDPNNALDNTRNAMNLAEENFGIPQIIEPENLCVPNPDELSVMTYLGYYCNKESPGKNSLLEWIQEKIPHRNITNFTSDWKDGVALACLADVVSGGQFPEYEDMSPDDPIGNANRSMDFAETLGVPKTVTPEDFVDPALDPLQLMTYLSHFKRVAPSGDPLAGISAAGPGITGDKANKETNFVVRGRIPDWAPLEVVIKAPDGKRVDHQRTQTVPTSNVVKYTPTIPGTYVVEVKVNNEHIRGSPFTTHHQEPSNAKGCSASGSGLNKAVVGEKSEIVVDCTSGGKGSLQVEVNGPTGRIGTDISETSDRVYSVGMTPNEAGSHVVAITWSGQHIQGSPYTVNVVDPKSCTASGPGLTSALVNEPATFKVQCQNAGQGVLDVDITGPNGEEIPVKKREDSPNEFVCSFTPPAKGSYSIKLSWAGYPIGSPFKVVATSACDPSKCVVKDIPTGRLRAGKEAKFIVDTTEAGDGKLQAMGKGSSLPQDCSVRPLESMVYEVSFVPFEVGPLEVNATFDDKDIPNMPLTFTVNDPTKCHVNATALEKGTYSVKEPVSFRVSAQYAGKGDISAKLHCPEGEKVPDIEKIDDGTYQIQFVPTTGGAHAISIFFDDQQIPNGIVKLFVEDGTGADDVIVTQPAPSKIGAYLVGSSYDYKVNAAGAKSGELAATGTGIRTGTKPKIDITDNGDGTYLVGVVTESPDDYNIAITWSGDPVPGSPFAISTVDAANASKVKVSGPHYKVGEPLVLLEANTVNAGIGELSARCHGDRQGNVPVKIKETNPKSYELSFQSPSFDSYVFSVLFSDNHVPGSPFTINNIPPDASKVKVTPPDSEALFGRPPFKVDVSEAGVGKLTANCTSKKLNNTPVTIKETEPNVYSVNFDSPIPDIYTLDMKWADEAVPGSPFKMNLYPVDASKVKITKPYTYTAPSVVFKADTSEAGEGKLSCKCNGKKSGPVKVAVNETSPYCYDININDLQADLYTADITYDGLNVPESPFTINLIPTDAGKVVVIGPDSFTVSMRAPFNVNAMEAGDGELTAFCRAENSANLPVEIKRISDDDHLYKVSVTPIKEDKYYLSILWNKRDVPRSPFLLDLIPPTHVDRVVVGDPVFRSIDEPVEVTVDISQAGPGKLSASCKGDSAGQVDVDIREPLLMGDHILSFIPTVPDDYTLSVFYNNNPVPRSPLTISAKPITELADSELIPEPVIEMELQSAPPSNDIGEEKPPPAELEMEIGNPLVVDVDIPAKESILAGVGGEEVANPVPVVTATAIGDATGVADIGIEGDHDAYHIEFNPRKPDRYTINIMADGKPTPSSPIIVNYKAGFDSSKCFIIGLDKVPDVPMINLPISFGVDATEAGNGELSVTSDGPSSDQDHMSSVNVLEDTVTKGLYTVSYTPTAPGKHNVFLKWAGDVVRGSPLLFQVVSDSAISGDQVYPFGKPVGLQVTAECKAKQLESHAVLRGTNVHNKLKVSKGPKKGIFNLGFQPSTPGFYDVFVKLDGRDVAGSPYSLRYADPPNPSKVQVTMSPNEVGYLNEPVEFSIDTNGAGISDLKLRINIRKKAKDKRKAPDFKVDDFNDGVYTAKFVPIHAAPHQFEILYGDEPVPGSPFPLTVKMKPPSVNHILSSNLNLILVGKPVDVYFKLSEDDSVDSISTSVTGEYTDDAEVKIQTLEGEREYRAHFVPTNPDDYQVEVLHDKRHISGSPFPIKVIGLGGFEQSKSPSDVENPPIIPVETPFNLLLPIDYSVEENIVASIEGPDAANESVEVRNDEKGSYSVVYTPETPGEYLVNVKKGDQELNGSPFRLIVKETRSDPTKCFILEDDKSIFQKPQRFGKPINFRISTSEAGPGTLNITSRGPGKADVRIFDNSNGTYTCEFTPSVAGKYNVDILWDDQHIAGSPYELTFKEKKKKVITGLDLDLNNFKVNVPHRFKLHCEEIGTGSLELAVKPATAAQIKVSNIKDDSYQVEILPIEPGNHELSVTYGGNHIFGSPYNVSFNQRGDASKCRMISSDVEPTEEGRDHVIFVVSIEGAGEGKLTAHVDNPQSGERQQVKIDEIEPFVHKVHFDLGEGSEYQLVIKYDGEHIEGSPFKLLFADEVDASVCRAEGDGLVTSVVDKEASFTVSTEGAGDGELKITITAEDGFEIRPRLTNEVENEHVVKYTPTRAGKYNISVQFADQEITNSPFEMKSYVALHPANLIVVDPVSEGYVGVPIGFKVDVIEEMKEEGELQIRAKSRKTEVVGLSERDPNGGRGYLCTIEPSLTGRYDVKILLNGENITGSPFKLKISDPPKPENVRVYGPGISDGFVGQEGNFTIETEDAGTGTMSVRVHGPKGAFKINMRRHPENERTILVRYDPKYAGIYKIDITWSEVHVTGSPFTVDIKEQTEADKGDENNSSLINGMETSATIEDNNS